MALVSLKVVVVVVIKRSLVLLVLSVLLNPAAAETLPEDMLQLMYHSYDGGGVEVNGPALLVRKEFKDQFSVNAGYYQDSISGASPDVIASASAYSETRDEFSLGVDALLGNSLVSLGYINSEEDDYEGNNFSFGISQSFFAQMTTMSLGYTVGQDTVKRVDNDFAEDIDRYQFSVGLTQVLTSTMLMNLTAEGITEEGYLSNPYRSKRVFGTFAGPEIYPRTRTSTAFAVRLKKLLWGDDAASFSYRYFDDSWDIVSHTLELGFTRTLNNRSVADVVYRYYDQSGASFFSSDFQGLFQFMASDKELSTYQSHTIGLNLTYELFNDYLYGFDRGELGFAYDFRMNEYEDYFAPNSNSTEPYEFDANVFNINLSLFY